MSYILIAEDEEFLARAVKDNLEVEGYEVQVAENGEEAVKLIRKRIPDLLLLDLLMPKKDGFYVLEELKNNPDWKLIPVVVFSNLGDDTNLKKAISMGANDYFVKAQHPIEEVIDKVKEYTRGNRPAMQGRNSQKKTG
ncbi:MAG TPA: response regulator [Candidatus Paceibacterota bacterium]|nr:response regulator [Candidatus Paceibacterota bacterium]